MNVTRGKRCWKNTRLFMLETHSQWLNWNLRRTIPPKNNYTKFRFGTIHNTFMWCFNVSLARLSTFIAVNIYYFLCLYINKCSKILITKSLKLLLFYTLQIEMAQLWRFLRQTNVTICSWNWDFHSPSFIQIIIFLVEFHRKSTVNISIQALQEALMNYLKQIF